jgi:hypothetical protein
MKTSRLLLFAILVVVLAGPGCARRMLVTTGTTIGLVANPGDGQSQPPQITFAYKRAEMAYVPTSGSVASNNTVFKSDAFSSLALVNFKTKFFGATSIDQFIATGHASRDIQDKGTEFTAELLKSVNARIAIENINITQVVAAVDDGTGKVDAAKYNKLAKGTSLEPAASAFVGKSVSVFETFLKKDGRPFVGQLQENNK